MFKAIKTSLRCNPQVTTAIAFAITMLAISWQIGSHPANGTVMILLIGLYFVVTGVGIKRKNKET
ncbi:hypothetical protein CWE22_11150 [Pseudidiomarina aestuarii]|uniref:Uncharacterized protein n=1 Tax=Pseudidiomarina aestuarii TaxID=624146 RepID=A0A7Z6ZS78_9GAMM|nr:hypothetical protein [Pseudidiomarina aestuarii]RUO38975.1 hypothetical protein CWE22_11150 [Pseudidiomarina aestuarii]